MSSQDEIKEVAGEIIGWDARIVKTIQGLTLRPGHMIREYCTGHANRYVSPLAYYFTGVAIAYYLFEISGLAKFLMAVNQQDVHTTFQGMNGVLDASKAESLHYSFLAFLSSETGSKLISLVIALLFRWWIFKKHEPGFKSNAWFSMFTMGHESVLVGVPTILGWFMIPDKWVALGIISTGGLLYDTWASKHFYAISWGRSIWLNLVLTLLTYVLISAILFIGIMVTLAMSVA